MSTGQLALWGTLLAAPAGTSHGNEIEAELRAIRAPAMGEHIPLAGLSVQIAAPTLPQPRTPRPLDFSQARPIRAWPQAWML